MPELSAADGIVAANIRRLREHRGLTQGRVAELAADAGFKLSEMSIWALENGRRYIRVADVWAAAAILKAAPEDLIREDFDPSGGQRDDAPAEGPRTDTFQVQLEGGQTETVTANQSFVDDDKWINFYLRGERVFFAPAARIVCCRAVEETP